MIKLCPNCNKRYVVDKNTIDYIHQCHSGNPTIDQEDVVVVGNWEDYSGSGTVPPQQVLMQGAHNELFGKDASLEGDDIEDVTKRGKRVSTHRQRQREQFINISKKGLD